MLVRLGASQLLIHKFFGRVAGILTIVGELLGVAVLADGVCVHLGKRIHRPKKGCCIKASDALTTLTQRWHNACAAPCYQSPNTPLAIEQRELQGSSSGKLHCTEVVGPYCLQLPRAGHPASQVPDVHTTVSDEMELGISHVSRDFHIAAFKSCSCIQVMHSLFLPHQG